MADYFTNLSFIVPLTNKEQKAYALDLARIAGKHQFDEAGLPKDFPESLKEELEDWHFEVEKCEQGIWVHSDSGGIGAICAFVQHLLQKFKFAPNISFEWSHDCTQPRTDAFGGGAAFITASAIETFSTSTWLSSKTQNV